MRSYWSCTSLADKIRGTIKPKFLPLGEWSTWDASAKAKYPLRYWLAEDGLDIIQRIVNSPVDLLHKIRYYISVRFVTKTHQMSSNLRRGVWWELDTRMKHCMFDELNRFVEQETAWHHVMWDEDARKKYKSPRFNFRTWRCKEAGLEHLEWASKLVYTDEQVSPESGLVNKPTGQAVAAQEILELYNWWNNVHATRADPYLTLDNDVDDLNCLLTIKPSEHYEIAREIEDRYEKEDEEMMIRLVKIRKQLWT